jgi:Histidine kinase-, DNA gyrase B-, and HSP90-like ATPase
MIEDDTPVLEFDHNVIEHLGIRLYQNKIPNVLSELISNSWDADAKNVYIDISQNDTPSSITVMDNGIGMSFDDIKNRYLIIGKPKRGTPKDLSPSGRKPMGRKGIGKLAPFGIAKRVDVLTLSQNKLNWFSLDLNGILDLKPGNLRYAPPFYISEESNQDKWLNFPDAYCQVHFKKCLEFLKKIGHGTCILMSQLNTNELILDTNLRITISDKYNIVLARSDFELSINGVTIRNEDCMPDFDLRIPAAGFAEELIGGRNIRYWVGFVGSAKWSSEQAGVGVYAHGKIAQDRPFFFYSRGKEIFQRYLYGVVEADWIDELEEDIISTDRTSIDWSNTNLAQLKQWGSKKVLQWLEDYSTHRGARHLQEVKEYAHEQRRLKAVPVFTEHENDAIDDLVAEATKDLGKDQENARGELLNAVSKAWINLPSRTLTKSLWKSLSDAGSEGGFLKILDQLQIQSVPEAMGLAMTFAQRAYALSILSDLVHQKSETKLQHLVEDFPWIIQPRGDLLTSNQHLKTTIDAAASALGPNDYDRAGRVIKGMTEEERADFVFLTDGSQKKIVIYEIKGPNHELTQENRRQLVDYIDFVEQSHSSAEVSGVLIGRMPKPPIAMPDTRLEAKGWDTILLECRASNVSLLAAMLDRADPAPNDARVSFVHEFGGKEVWSLLKKMSENDDRLKVLMEKYDKYRLQKSEA